MFFFDATGLEIKFGDLIYFDDGDRSNIMGIFECYRPETAEKCPEYIKNRMKMRDEDEERWFDQNHYFYPTIIVRELNNPKSIFKRSLHGVRKVPDTIAMVLKLEKATRDEDDA